MSPALRWPMTLLQYNAWKTLWRVNQSISKCWNVPPQPLPSWSSVHQSLHTAVTCWIADDIAPKGLPDFILRQSGIRMPHLSISFQGEERRTCQILTGWISSLAKTTVPPLNWRNLFNNLEKKMRESRQSYLVNAILSIIQGTKSPTCIYAFSPGNKSRHLIPTYLEFVHLIILLIVP